MNKTDQHYMDTNYDMIIIGGSYAGLAAATSLGRALRKVAVIDSGKPCNAQTPHSHNFLTRDGETPADIAAEARRQLEQYKTVSLLQGKVTKAEPVGKHFTVGTEDGRAFTAQKVLFATGIADQFPAIDGLKESWGISILHCPYCHGYEVHGQTLGVLGNGDPGFEQTKLISNWTDDLTLFTNGPSTLSNEQHDMLTRKGIKVEQAKLISIKHTGGYIDELVFEDGIRHKPAAIFTHLPFVQHSLIPQQVGCDVTTTCHLAVDQFYRTNVSGIYAAGDCTTFMRSVAMAVAAGTTAGAIMNKDMIDESFAQ